ncbi:MAG: hypothetical protein A3J09_00440 [Candidatus Zambryskibacteria bacterium RIFCSPLOWO2_02_FULL_51_21]|uniref:DNA polymerase III delta N-terminal domain-containing protein n=1 Tax=Candidatus Zambryskibacteria bacterium RIFCSPHIGHO2_02_FULL_43_37 TaxID=1802749 RepID=A0A1G2TJX1_9BACT|nr:MAG: hypothetical protein A2723_00440 [Candidatus Zambryskibacteria bacterium RIFCSPHIGHO2_01_FULL_52_18]OHA96921.1 MAG: hypothetical protein A3D49_02340 [Candidatus Zambryskibacteria bacterium RIFCSPHIGHO2_02_FULL_43_37]OHB06702.1 MAG: hypothetical protein A2944_02530 [Candidatus Zambryskibacteria bacterium RIFCSPLOWO2_01_FULL_52_12]OHB11034.1 MAG: hypothetical protein A3J09_00440 [Candidatus Zambryskibacteria bacterium RIFCSPLOWO2_02_FULL_51_21]
MHHAYLLVGSAEQAEKYLREFVGDLTGSPDYFVFKDDVFGIGDARKLSESAVRKAFTDRKIFLIAPVKITREAQNALLKTFEDPVENTHFFLAAREEELIIPTLCSRMRVVRLSSEASEANEASKFLRLPIKDRLNFVKKFVDKEENLSVFLDELLALTRSKKIYDVRKFSDDRSASSRLILEHLALVLDNI